MIQKVTIMITAILMITALILGYLNGTSEMERLDSTATLFLISGWIVFLSGISIDKAIQYRKLQELIFVAILLFLIMLVNVIGILSLPDQFVRTFVILWSTFGGFMGAIYARHWLRAFLFGK